MRMRIANWHGGYDEEGDYTGEGEYDANMNYVGPKPTEEALRQTVTGWAAIWRTAATPDTDSLTRMEIT